MKELLAFEQVSYHYDSSGEREALFPLSVRLYQEKKLQYWEATVQENPLFSAGKWCFASEKRNHSFVW